MKAIGSICELKKDIYVKKIIVLLKKISEKITKMILIQNWKNNSIYLC